MSASKVAVRRKGSCSCGALSLANRRRLVSDSGGRCYPRAVVAPESSGRRARGRCQGQRFVAGGFRCCPLWSEGGQGPWVLVPAPFFLSVFGRVPLAPHPWVGKLPALHLSLGGRGDKNDQGLQGAGGREMLGQTGQRESHALGCLTWIGERRAEASPGGWAVSFQVFAGQGTFVGTGL